MKVSVVVVALGVVSLLTDASSEMIVPILPLFLVLVLHADYFLVGLIDGLAEMCANVARVLSGWYADRVSRRKPFLMFGYGIGAVLKPLMGASTSWLHVAALRSTERVGKGVRGPPRDAIVAEVTDKSIRGRAFGLHRAMDTTGAILGSVLALVLILLLTGAEGDKYRAIIVLSAIPVVVAIFVLLVFVKEERKERRPRERTFRTSFKAFPRDVKRFFLVSSLLSIGATNVSFMILRGSGIGLSDQGLILLYIVFNVVYAASSYPLGISSDQVGRRAMLVLGFGIGSLVQVVLAFSDVSPVLIVISFLVNGVFMAMTEGMQKAFVVDLTTPESKGTALGIHYAVVGVSTFVGGLLIGWLWTYFNPLYAFMVPAVLIIAGLVAFVALFGVRKKEIAPT